MEFKEGSWCVSPGEQWWCVAGLGVEVLENAFTLEEEKTSRTSNHGEEGNSRVNPGYMEPEQQSGQSCFRQISEAPAGSQRKDIELVADWMNQKL